PGDHMAIKSPLTEKSIDETGRKEWFLIFLLLACLVLLTYGPCLDNYFWEIDDQRHVANGAGEPFPNNYFRPGQALSFQLLWKVAGTDPFPYYLLGIGFHWIASCLLYAVARRFLCASIPAAVAAVVFATLFAPHQAVCWIGAHLGVQSLAFSLAALLFWLIFLERGGVLVWAGTLVAAGLAVCFKETGLDLFLWMGVFHLWAKGPGDMLKLRGILAWIPFGILAVLISWRGATVPGGVGIELHWAGPVSLIGRLIRSLSLMPLPLEFQRWRFYPWIIALGIAVVVLPLLGALLVRSRAPKGRIPLNCRLSTAATAVAVLLCGHGAILLGEPEIIGERFYYDAAPGFAFLSALLFIHARAWLPQTRCVRSVLWGLLITWIAIQVSAIHKIEAWKYDRTSRRVEALVDSTARELSKESHGERLLFLSPPLPDLDDFACILRVWLSIPAERINSSPGELADDPGFRQRLFRSQGERIFRWDEDDRVWIPFNPGGEAWLDSYEPEYWPGGLKDPNLPKEVCYVMILPDEE
ncbi:MAG: hypothetical protein KJ645_02125, partial [Planctomycetes bacterium]|nr:hypothetical protein [Planctomycetota bacterium]